MSETKRLKITQKGFEKYNGPISVYEFKDGVSVEPIPRHQADRIAATMNCVEVTEQGDETVAGVSERLITEAKLRAPKAEKLSRQTVDNKVSEEKQRVENILGVEKQIYSEDELDAIIEEGGIKALREIATSWNVKNRSIPTLRQMILDEQEQYQTKHGKRIDKAKEAVEKVVRDTAMANRSDGSVAATEEIPDEQKLIDAAVTGDLSVAIAQEGSQDLDDVSVDVEGAD